MKLSIVIPAYNEEARISPTLEGYLPYFAERYGDDFELVVVVNGSTDGTERVVQGYLEGHPQLRLIVEPERIGKGGALLVGLTEAKGDTIGFVDADGATAPASFDDLVKVCGPKHAVIGSRWCRGAVVTIKQSFVRRLASRCFNLCVRLLFGLNISDTQCGAKVFSREALAAALPGIGLTQWAFDVDLLYQLKRAGYAVKEVPTVWHDVKGSRIKVARTSMGMFAALVRLRLMHSPFKGLVRLYGPRVDFLGRLRKPSVSIGKE